jgi:hypothetical protein
LDVADLDELVTDRVPVADIEETSRGEEMS